MASSTAPIDVVPKIMLIGWFYTNKDKTEDSFIKKEDLRKLLVSYGAKVARTVQTCNVLLVSENKNDGRWSNSDSVKLAADPSVNQQEADSVPDSPGLAAAKNININRTDANKIKIIVSSVSNLEQDPVVDYIENLRKASSSRQASCFCCDACGQEIPMAEALEHADYHVALALASKDSKEHGASQRMKARSSTTGKKNKNKRKSAHGSGLMAMFANAGKRKK